MKDRSDDPHEPRPAPNSKRPSSVRWIDILSRIFETEIPKSCSWTNLDEIVDVLNQLYAWPKFCETTLPSGGFFSMIGARASSEPNCLELVPIEGVAYVCRPKQLDFEFMDETPSGSIFVLQTETLEPKETTIPDAYDEELLLLPDGRYVDMVCFDEGYVDYYGNCDEPVPENATQITRVFSGSWLIHAINFRLPKSLSRRDGWQGKMTGPEVRFALENS